MAGIVEPAQIVGVGQRYAGDDGVGREVVRQLVASGIAARGVDDGAALLNLLMAAPSRVLVVDAVVGGAPPGTVHVLDRADFDTGFRPVSSHGIDVVEAIDLATRFNPGLKVTLIGISINAPTFLGEGLSPDVSDSVSEAAKRVMELLAE